MENELKEPALKYNYISPEDYLKMERAATEKHEYCDGGIFAMAGASLQHNRIVSNIISSLGSYLKGKKCEIFPSDLRVSTPNKESYMYPDVTIVCDDPQMEDDQFDTLKNPSVIFEVLSPSTRGIDKGRKFFFYMQIPSLNEYILIDSKMQHVFASRKQPDNSWKFEQIEDADASLFIESIKFSLPLKDIYENTGL